MFDGDWVWVIGTSEVPGVTALPGERPAADRANVILTPDQRSGVFISSTLEELAAERVAARRVRPSSPRRMIGAGNPLLPPGSRRPPRGDQRVSTYLIAA